jgi:hypothetical protein
MKKHILTMLLLMSMVFAAMGQTEPLQLITTSGAMIEGPSSSLSWTLGEVVVEMINDEDGTLSQGFQQPCQLPPMAMCADVTVELDAGGSVVVEGTDIDAGSTDDCGVIRLQVSPVTFSCSDVGTHTVTLTVSDLSGNSSSCAAVVTVVRPQLSLVWTGAEDSDWKKAANWNIDCAPESSDLVSIPAAVTHPVMIYGPDEVEAANITIETGATLTVAGILHTRVTSGDAVSNNGIVIVEGDIFFSGGHFVNHGLLKGSGRIQEKVIN